MPHAVSGAENVPYARNRHTNLLRHIYSNAKSAACAANAVSVCPTGALEIIGKDYTVDALLQEVKKDAVFYGRRRRDAVRRRAVWHSLKD